MAAEKKVRFGLKKVHYALLESGGTYGTPKPWTGAVALTLPPEGERLLTQYDDFCRELRDYGDRLFAEKFGSIPIQSGHTEE